jgi:hypothetical protein
LKERILKNQDKEEMSWEIRVFSFGKQGYWLMCQ